VTVNVDHGDALDELCAQLTRDLFAIAKFLLILLLVDTLCKEKTMNSRSFSVTGVDIETHLCVGTFLT